MKIIVVLDQLMPQTMADLYNSNMRRHITRPPCIAAKPIIGQDYLCISH